MELPSIAALHVYMLQERFWPRHLQTIFKKKLPVDIWIIYGHWACCNYEGISSTCSLMGTHAKTYFHKKLACENTHLPKHSSKLPNICASRSKATYRSIVSFSPLLEIKKITQKICCYVWANHQKSYLFSQNKITKTRKRQHLSHIWNQRFND